MAGTVFTLALVLLAQMAPGPPAPVDEDDMEAQLERVRTRSLLQGKVCPDPARPCEGFEPYELSFRILEPFQFDRGEDRSQPFFAVILESGPLCGIAEERRLAAQAAFPGRKVFVHRHLCQGFGDDVTYTDVDRTRGFIAVYAGEAEAGARKLLAEVKAAGRFPGANLRKMQVVVTYQLE